MGKLKDATCAKCHERISRHDGGRQTASVPSKNPRGANVALHDYCKPTFIKKLKAKSGAL